MRLRPANAIFPGLISVCLILTPGCRPSTRPESRVKPVVSVSAVESRMIGAGRRYTARLEPWRQVPLAFNVAGLVNDIRKSTTEPHRAIRTGDPVAAGTILARLRRAEYAVRVDRAEKKIAESTADVSAARARLDQALAAQDRSQRDADRAEHLFAAASLTRPDYDAVRAAVEIARKRSEEARAQLELAQARVTSDSVGRDDAAITLDDTTLKAPFSGVVVNRLVDAGSFVEPGKTIVEIADISRVRAIVGIPDTALAGIKAGAVHTVSADALPGETFPGTVSAVAQVADPVTHLFTVELEIPNRENRLKPGMVATVEIGDGRRTEHSLTVPLAALVRSKDGSNGFTVYCLEGSSASPVVRLRRITVGETIGNMVTVTSGLNPGERVVTLGATLVNDGDAVTLLPTESR